MGTVKYSGPITSFHCPTEATIRSLKVHFSPKQEGSGDPSPENVREIIGWDGVEVEQSGKNLMHLLGYSAVNLTTTTATRKLTNSNGTTISTIDPEKSVTITQTLWPATNKYSYQNGYFIVMDDNLKFEERYDISFRVINIINNPLNATLSDLMLYNPKGTSVGSTKIIDGDRITFKNAIYNQNTTTPLRHGFDIRICGMSCTISDFIVTAVDIEDRAYEPYRGETIDYEFGVLGKNKFNWDVPVSESSPVGSDPSTAREFTLDTYVIGMSVNNYYRQNYTNWVLNPSVENGVVSFSSGGASGYGIAFPLKLAAGQTYFLSGTGDGSVGATYYDVNGEFISYQNGRLNKTITVPENTATTLIGFYASTSNTEFTFSNIQFELGSSATTYEPYDPNKTVYGGWVDLITGEVCEEWKFEDLSASNTTVKTTTNLQYPYYMRTAVNNWVHSTDSLLFNMIPNTQTNAMFRSATCGWQIPGSSNVIYWVHPDCATEEGAESLRTNANIKLIYKVSDANSSTYHLAPTQLQTFLGQNNVWSNADYVEVEYDLHETQDILARKQFIVANQPHIEEASGSIATFNTDLVAPLKECKAYFEPIQDLHGYDRPWVGGSGKNLFNINAVEQDPDNTTVSNSSARKFTTGTYAKGASYSNYWQASQIIECTINNNTITVSATTGYGVGFPIKMKEGTTYFISCTMMGNSNGQINIAPYDVEGNYLGDAVLANYVNRAYTAPANIDIGVIIFRNQTSKDNPVSTTFSNIQVEVGTAATSYEPYENICPISGWTELEVTRCGKNFSTAATGTEIVQKWPIISSSRTLKFSGMEPGQEFTLSASFTKASEPGSNKRLYLNGSQLANSTTNSIFDGPRADEPHNSVIHNWVNENGEIWIAHNNRGLTYNDDFIEYAASLQNIQLEVGDTATAFEPYNGTTIPITFPSEAGTVYGGYVDLANGELVQTWNYIRANERTWSNYSAYQVFYTNKSDRSADSRDISDKLKSYTGYGWSNAPDNSIISGNRNSMFIKHLGVSSNAEFKEWLDEVDPIIYYELAEPIHYTLTPTQLKTLRGTNNIWSNAGDITLSYWTH